MSASFLQDDIDTILDVKTFGVTGGCVWNGVKIEHVIFDDEDVEVTMGEGVAEIIPQPTLTGKTSDFSGIADGDSVQVLGETFEVKNWKKDGTGVIEIFLVRNT